MVVVVQRTVMAIMTFVSLIIRHETERCQHIDELQESLAQMMSEMETLRYQLQQQQQDGKDDRDGNDKVILTFLCLVLFLFGNRMAA